jgi:hypothetical protein
VQIDRRERHFDPQKIVEKLFPNQIKIEAISCFKKTPVEQKKKMFIQK